MTVCLSLSAHFQGLQPIISQVYVLLPNSTQYYETELRTLNFGCKFYGLSYLLVALKLNQIEHIIHSMIPLRLEFGANWRKKVKLNVEKF